jgi:hypothetical protein
MLMSKPHSDMKFTSIAPRTATAVRFPASGFCKRYPRLIGIEIGRCMDLEQHLFIAELGKLIRRPAARVESRLSGECPKPSQ